MTSEAPFILSRQYRINGSPVQGDCPGCHVGQMRRQGVSTGVLHLVCDVPGCGQEVLMPVRQVATQQPRTNLAARRDPVPELAS